MHRPVGNVIHDQILGEVRRAVSGGTESVSCWQLFPRSPEQASVSAETDIAYPSLVSWPTPNGQNGAPDSTPAPTPPLKGVWGLGSGVRLPGAPGD